MCLHFLSFCDALAEHVSCFLFFVLTGRGAACAAQCAAAAGRVRARHPRSHLAVAPALRFRDARRARTSQASGKQQTRLGQMHSNWIHRTPVYNTVHVRAASCRISTGLFGRRWRRRTFFATCTATSSKRMPRLWHGKRQSQRRADAAVAHTWRVSSVSPSHCEPPVAF